MSSGAEQSRRKPRSDATRNRERLMTAAKLVFAKGGGEASLEAVARQAGVGIATLYRNFPTREALYEAVYRHEVDELVALAGRLAVEGDPVDALRHWLRAIVDLVATKKGMVTTLALTADTTTAISARLSQRLSAALSTLLDRAVAEGRVVGDVTGEEMLLALVGMCLLRDQPGWQDSAVKMMQIMVDGLLVRDAEVAKSG